MLDAGEYIALRAGAGFDADRLYETFARLRHRAPVWRSPWGDIYVSTYGAVDDVLADHRFSHSPVHRSGEAWTGYEAVSDWVLYQDGEEHRALREMFSSFLSLRGADLAERVATVVDEVLRRVDFSQPVEVVAAFTRAIPERVICELLGVPRQDAPRLRAWSAGIRCFLDSGLNNAPRHDRRAVDGLTEYFHCQHTAWRQSADIAGPKEQLSSRLMAANIGFLAFSGHETTVHLLGSMLYHLQRNMDAWERLRRDTGAASAIVAESLRLESPVQKACRWAREDIELAGTVISRGEPLVLLLGSANRDPTRFNDPDRMDLTRTEKHLAFGRGAHFCVGNLLARLEAEALLQWLSTRFTGIGTAGKGPMWMSNSSFRGLERLTLRFVPE